jgi:hypothetical protein
MVDLGLSSIGNTMKCCQEADSVMILQVSISLEQNTLFPDINVFPTATNYGRFCSIRCQEKQI